VIGNPKHFASVERKIIHVDIDPSSISKRVRVDIPIVGDVKEVLTELMLICSIYVGLARFLHVARIEVEADYMPELREFPLPPG
jgi:thiamine pyrophosphate-dependent acetolactate synthase large subunit-like protein